jgi:hypothetical protein
LRAAVSQQRNGMRDASELIQSADAREGPRGYPVQALWPGS